MGGGSRPVQTTTSSGIDPEFKPYLETALSKATDLYTGSFNPDGSVKADQIVSPMTSQQTGALQAAEAQAKQQMAGTGAYDYTGALGTALQNTVGTAAGQAALAGQAGSARAQKMMASAIGDKSLEFQQLRQADQMAGAKGMGDVGSAYQAYNQQVLDAPHTATQRYFGYLGSAPQQQTSTQTGGGK